MCFVQELICCHTLKKNIFGKGYVNNYYKSALNRIFNVEISQIRVLINKISLIFELLFNFADFLSYLTTAPFLWRGSIKTKSMCFVQEFICCHTFLINIFGKIYENNYCKTASNRIFDIEISQIRVLNSKISLIFELLNFADFLSYLTPAPFLCKGSRFYRLVYYRVL